MSEQPPHESALEFSRPPLPDADLSRLLLQAAQAAGVSITFAPGSNPHFHVHIGELMAGKKESGDQYTDQSSGATGAKSFGPQSTATNSGQVLQSAVFTPTQSAELVQALESLTSLVRDVQLADNAKLVEILSALEQAKKTATSDNAQKSAITGVWEKAKAWLSSALSVGLFVTEKGEQVRTLLAKITALVS
jgi:hypothetical protein